MTNPWTDHIIHLKDDYAWSFSAIAKEINAIYPGTEMTKDRAQKIYKRAKDKVYGLKPAEPDPRETYEGPAVSTTDAIRDWLEDTWEDETDLIPVEGKERKIVVVADLHGCPDKRLLQMIVAEQPDRIVVGGDLLDSKSVSEHPYNPNDKQTSLKEEVQNVRAWLQVAHKKLPRTMFEVLHGNHDAWFSKRVSKYIPHELMYLIKDPLDLVVAGMDRTWMIETKLHAVQPDGETTQMGETQYVYLLGDALISHADFTGKYPGDASKKLRSWVNDHRRWLDWPEIALAIQCHTHKSYYGEFEGGHYVAVEPGVGGDPSLQRYGLSYQLKWTPAPTGAVTFVQRKDASDHWRTVRSSIRLLRPYR